MLKRLTVHLENVKPERVKTGYPVKPGSTKEEVKMILNNTISVHNLTSEVEIKSALSEIRNNHKIAKCKKPNHKTWKVGDEMWYTSNETL
jgi:hypothetical protein